MGFETQEEAERFAEAVDLRRDQLKEERALVGYSDAHLIGALRSAAMMYGSEDMRQEFRAAADRIEALRREVHSYQKFERDIKAAFKA